MTRNRAKGTRYETECVTYLRSRGVPAFRSGNPSNPEGDIEAVPFCSVECKNQKEQRLGIWLEQSAASAARRGLLPVVFHKRRLKGAAESYVTMTLATFVDLLEKVNDARAAV